MSQNSEETKAPDGEFSSATEGGGDGGSNPFTSDLKGEFTSSFGSETNTVSRLLSDGGFGAKKGRMWLIVAGIVIVAGGGFMLLQGGSGTGDTDQFGNSDDNLAISEDSDEFQEEDSDLNAEGDETEDILATDDDLEDAQITAEEVVEDQIAEERIVEQEQQLAEDEQLRDTGENTPEGEMYDQEQATNGEMTQDAMANDGMMGADPATTPEDMDAAVPGLDSSEKVFGLNPPNGASRSYDETSEYADFSWGGSPGGFIYFSRNRSMQPAEKMARVSGNSYRLRHPWPGTWYWKVQNGAGGSEVASFRVSPAIRRNVALNQPQGGGVLSGNGGMVSWSGDSKVARYKVEISGSGWANPDYKFQTSGSDLQLQNVAAGSYQMRVGAFSEVSGRWEFTQPVDVVVE